jgi:hypothetical protein
MMVGTQTQTQLPDFSEIMAKNKLSLWHDSTTKIEESSPDNLRLAQVSLCVPALSSCVGQASASDL